MASQCAPATLRTAWLSGRSRPPTAQAGKPPPRDSERPGRAKSAADRRARRRTLQRRRGFVGRLVKTSESRSSAGRGLRTPRDVRPSVGRLRELVRAERRADGNKHNAAAQSLLSGPISGSDRSRSPWGSEPCAQRWAARHAKSVTREAGQYDWRHGTMARLRV